MFRSPRLERARLFCGSSAVPCAGRTSAFTPMGRRTWCRRRLPGMRLSELFTRSVQVWEVGSTSAKKLSSPRSWAAESAFTANASNTTSVTHSQRWATIMQGDSRSMSRFLPAAVAQGNVIPIPNSMSVERAALIEPLSCVLNGQEYLSPQPADRGVIFGAGPIGLMHASILKARGCDPVIVADVSQERLDYVRDFGVGLPVNTSGGDAVNKIMEAGGGEKFDVAIVACSVKAAQADALKLVRKKARVSFFAGVPKDDPVLGIDTNLIHYNEISVFGCFASNLQHYHQALEMVSRDDLPWDRFLTHRFKLQDMVKAYAVVEAGQGIKAVIDCE